MRGWVEGSEGLVVEMWFLGPVGGCLHVGHDWPMQSIDGSSSDMS